MSKTTERHWQADAAAQQRIAWITHALMHACGLGPVDVRGTALIRRAVAVYAMHLDDIIAGYEGDSAITKELRILGEAQRVRESSQSSDLGLTDAQLTANPVQALSTIQVAARAAMPTVLDQLKSDLLRSRRT